MPQDEDYTLVERAYWRSPTRVFTGLTWFVLGFGLGVLLSMVHR